MNTHAHGPDCHHEHEHEHADPFKELDLNNLTLEDIRNRINTAPDLTDEQRKELHDSLDTHLRISEIKLTKAQEKRARKAAKRLRDSLCQKK